MLYRFGVFEFDAATSVLRKNGRVVALEPQPSRALAVLLSHTDEVVSRDELKDAVWGRDTHVDFDRGLAYCLSQIRTALGDSGDNPRFVQTIPKRGYRFIAPVTRGDEPVGVQAPVPGSRLPVPVVVLGVLVMAAAALLVWAAARVQFPPADRFVVAVSIFDNETGDPQFDRLVGGLSDLVVTRLTEMDSRLAVVGNRATFAISRPWPPASRRITSCLASCNGRTQAIASSPTSSA